jgi:hypothetical protein
LNTTKNMEAIMQADPGNWVISLSGFSQDLYQRTHTMGDIEVVKENMRKLRDYKKKHNSNTQVSVSYHCYKDNMGADYQDMSSFCRELGFIFVPTVAYFYPLEKVMDAYEGRLKQEDKDLIDLLIVSPEDAREISLRKPSADCGLRANMMTINCDGSVALCCTVYDDKYTISKSFLETPLEELQQRKYSHDLCKKCMKNGMHDTFLYNSYEDWCSKAEENLPGVALPRELMPQA